MLGLVTLFVVIVVSLLVTRIATVALVLTGLSREAARFQARSALRLADEGVAVLGVERKDGTYVRGPIGHGRFSPATG